MEKQITLVMTGGGCPEQYDALIGDEIIGYLRLRHGSFRAEYLGYPEPKIVCTAEPDGDGSFQEEERTRHLNRACRALIQEYQEHKGLIEDDSEEPIYALCSPAELPHIYGEDHWARHF